MRAHGHASVWRTHSGVDRARDTKSWYQQLRDWWTAHQAARQQASLEALHRSWDAKREGVTSRRADAALDMAAAQRAPTVPTWLYGFAL